MPSSDLGLMLTVVTRSEDRGGYTPAIRIRLLEGDADKTDAHFEAIEAKLNKILWALIGVLISLTTGGILLALNIVLLRGK